MKAKILEMVEDEIWCGKDSEEVGSDDAEIGVLAYCDTSYGTGELMGRW